jgi:GT2 family glycosyltransferase
MYTVLPYEPPTGLNIGLLIGLPCRKDSLIPIEMAVAFASQSMPTNMNVAYCVLKGKPIEEARDKIVQNALEIGAKYLWFVDDDTVPPPNTVRKLITILQNHPEVMVATGVYCTKQDPPSPLVFRGNGIGSFWDWKVGEIFEITGCGAGCMMINTDVFKKLGNPPFFPWQRSTDENDPWEIAEDLSFCNKVREAGYKVVAHGGVLCDHYDVKTGKVFSLPENSYPYRIEKTSADITQLEQKEK